MDNKNRRRRKRRSTLTPRFGPNSPAMEIGLLRIAIESQKLANKESKD